MADIQRYLVKGDDEEFEFLIEADTSDRVPDEDEDYRDVGLPMVDMRKVHRMIRGYAMYAVGAFKNFALAEVEEMNLEFNLKIAGEAGVPILTKSSAEGSFKVQIKCKFKD